MPSASLRGGHDGTLSGSYVAGHSGQAFATDATHYVVVPDEAALNSGTISIDVWFRHDAVAGVACEIRR